MGSIKFDYSKAIGFISQHEIDCMQAYVDQAHKMIHEKTGLGNDFLGWVELPKNYDKEEFARIKKAAEKIKSDSDVLLVIGIGGSYLGARAAIEMASHSFRNNLSKDDRKSPEIYFVGQNISSTYMMDLIDVIKDKDISINVISKSGTTTEPAIAFRIFKDLLEKKYGKEEASKRFVAHIKKKFFVPRPFKKSTPKQNISSLYFSSFSFDADSHTRYNGRLYRYEKRNDEQVKNVFYVNGNLALKHRDILVESSSKLSQATLNYVLPYNLEKKVDFKQEYLLGFTVERYDNAFRDSVKSSNTIMKRDIENAIVNRYDADGVEELNTNIHYINRFYEYTILPVYFVEYEYKKKKYTTYMNGQTGKVGGKLPKSPIKIAFVSILGILIFAFFVFILPMLLN